MKKEDEILIQNKIDGTINPLEQEKFTQLLEHSPEAQIFYKKLTILNDTLKIDADKIPTVDLSDKIMRTIQHKNSSQTDKTKNLITHKSFHNNLFRYAALFIFGLFAGGILTYFIMNNDLSPNQQTIAGTMSKIPYDSNTVYSDEGTTIKVNNISTGPLFLAVISIETKEMVECRISDKLKLLNNESIIQLFDETELNLKYTDNQEMVYSCSGSTIFQIRAKNEDKIELSFFRNSKVIMHTMIN